MRSKNNKRRNFPIWLVAFICLGGLAGYLFSDEIMRVVERLESLEPYLTWLCGAMAFVISAAVLLWFPRIVVPAPTSSKYLELVRLTERRNRVRLSLFIMVGISLFSWGALRAVSSYERQESQFAASRFADGLSKIGMSKSGDDRWSAVTGFQILAGVAAIDPSYHARVYTMLAQYIRDYSEKACLTDKWVRGFDDVKQTAAWRGEQFELPTEYRVLVAILAGRNVKIEDKVLSRHLNVERICLVKNEESVVDGFSKLFMPSAILVRGDFRHSTFADSDMRGINAGPDQLKIPDAFYKAVQAYDCERELVSRGFVADFRDSKFRDVQMQGAGLLGANLTGVHFDKVNLGGATLRYTNLENATFVDSEFSKWTDLRGANITGARFKNVKGLKAAHILSACANVEKGWFFDAGEPALPSNIRKKVLAGGGFKSCPPRPTQEDINQCLASHK